MIEPLHFSRLYNYCNPDDFEFVSTEELEPLTKIIGQDSALEAIDFSANIKQDGFNLFALGPSGSGKHSVVTAFLNDKANSEPAPDDWCYVNNFKDYRKPVAIRIPSGKAVDFKEDIDELITLLKSVLPSVFESNDYRNAKEKINHKYIDRQSEIFLHLQGEAKRHDVSMNATSPSHVTFVPVVDGKILTAEEFKSITGEQKEKINKKMSEFEKIVKEGLREVTQLNREEQKELRTLERRMTSDAVESVIGELREKYAHLPDIVDYLHALQDDVIAKARDFIIKPEELAVPPFMRDYYTPSFRRYEVNIFVSHENDTHAPVVFEDNPIHQNLIGRIEHISQVGTLVTDFTMIKPGALHKANGGYLILDARKLLMQPFAWEEMKRVLRSKEIRIESLAQQYSFISTTTLEPEPIPLNIKIVLVGERILYYLLYHYDPDFKELFKVSADFEDDIPRDKNNISLYAQMIGTIAKKNNLLPLTREAVARVIEQGSREARNASKISTHLRRLSDLLKESDYWARKEKCSVIDRKDIENALEAQTARVNRIQNRLYEQIVDGTVMINTSGSVIGQINALSYLSAGSHSFGIPSRVTAQTRPGKGEIIDIERKAELSGPIHTKGVMILSSYLGSKYAQKSPLSLSASLVFEQTYGKIEGDSASSTELYALLSSLSQLPIKQNIATTGSVNQFGEIQAIGGVNEKIEGFYDIAKQQDPETKHGVIIPFANIRHLMLKEEVVNAVKNGTFEIYAVSSIDEGIEILTGTKAGEINSRGNFPKGSVNEKVISRLHEFAKTAENSKRKNRKKAIDHSPTSKKTVK